MTIEIDGYMESLTYACAGKVLVTLRIEAARNFEPIKVIAKMTEIDMYRVGMPVKIQIRPLPAPPEVTK